MTAKIGGEKKRWFSVRNLLLFVTFLLMIVVIGLNVAQMSRALATKNIATRAQILNAVIDDIVQFKLALSDERLFINAAYGVQGEIPTNLKLQIQINRDVAATSYSNINANLTTLPSIRGEEENPEKFKQVQSRFNTIKSEFFAAYKAYNSMHDGIDQDLEQLSASARNLDAGDITKSINTMLDIAATMRASIELNYDYGDDRINNVNKLKNQLWVILEYAGRQAATISRSITSGAAIEPAQLSIAQIYDGTSKGAWQNVQQIAESTNTTVEIANQVAAIQSVFFNDFELKRFDIYDLSNYAAEDGEPTVDYSEVSVDDEGNIPLTIDNWVELSRNSSDPVIRMSSMADTLAKNLNQQAVSSADASVIMAWVLISVSMAAGGLALWIVITRVVRPVNALSDTMMVLADGNLEVDIPNADRNDEVGDMARSVQIFKDNAIERRDNEIEQRKKEEQERIDKEEEETRTREEQEENRARENIRSEKARAERRQEMLDLADQFEQSVMALVEGVSTSAKGMEQAAGGMSETAANTSQQSEVVANAAQQASTNAQMVASAAEELSSSVREITGQTNQSSAAARDAVARTENASTDVAQLVNAAEKIGEVVKLINEIAEQTNLLALNATIEAARAGDAGRGFAVVASEVKSLANQTANATQEISDQVSGMQNATKLAVNAMEEIKGIIGDIEATSVSIASAVEEQDASTQEIARNVSEVSTGTEEVTSNIHTVNEGATTTGTAAAEVLTAAQLLTQQSDDLRDQVLDFLKTIRA